MKMSIHKWNEIDFQELAAVMYAAKQLELQREDIKLLVNTFQKWKYDEPPVVICARSDETLIGWLVLHITNSTVAEINPGPFGGHPLVLPGEEEVRSSLVEEAINYALMKGIEKIDLTIAMEETDEFKQHESWYTACGFEPFYFCMKCTFSEHEYADVKIPAGVEISQTREVKKEDLYYCYYDAFSGGEAQFFFDQTEVERWGFFTELAPAEAVNEECSLVLMKDQQVIGFTYVLNYGREGNGHLNLICIHPDFQGQGLGRILLQLTMKKAAQQYKTMTLYTEADTNALELYKKCGFKKGGGSITYIYRVNDE